MKKEDLKTIAQFVLSLVIGLVIGAVIIYAFAHS